MIRCKECDSEVTAVKDADFESNGITHYFLADTKMQERLNKYEVPFICSTCGGLKFPFQAINGIVMVWPKPVPEKRGSIFIPERIRPAFKTSRGMVLSTGKGCIEKRTGRFVSSEVVPGDILSYDRGIPWQIEVSDSSGKKHNIDMMNVLDVQAIVEDDEDEKESTAKSA